MTFLDQLKTRAAAIADRTAGRAARRVRHHESGEPAYRTSDRQMPSMKQLKYLPKFFSSTERSVARLLTALLIITGLILVVKLYWGATYVVPGVGGTYTEALVGTPQTINPVLAPANDTDMDIATLVYSGLLREDTDRNLVGDLAESWSVSEDEKVYTFLLREGIMWHDGEALTADDVAFTINTIQDPDYASPLRGNFLGVSVSVLDDRTVQLTLTEPFAPFINNLTVGILPAHLWAPILPSNFPLAEQNLKPIGTGPYMFDSFTKNRQGTIKSYTLVRNEDYYERPPYVEQMAFRFYPDTLSAIEAGAKKVVDGVSYVPKTLKQDLAKNKDISYQLLSLPQYTAVFLNQKNTVLKQLAVKQALVNGADRQAIIDDVLGGEAEVINSPILPGFLGYNPEIKTYPFDPAKAMEVLDDDGWTMDDELGVRTKDGNELRFALTTVDTDEYIAVANTLKEYWEKIGIGVELRIIDSEHIQRTVIKPRDYEALLFGEIVGTDPDPYPFWHSSQGRDPGLNLSVYVNNDVDELLEGARKTSDEEQRRMKYIHFQNILVDELPAVFLYNSTYTYALSSRVKGFAMTRLTIPSDRFADVTDWYIATDRKWGHDETDKVTTDDTSGESVEPADDTGENSGLPEDSSLETETVDTNADSGDAEPAE